jgi:hypothetical protein
MFEMKIAITLLVTFLLLVGFLGSNPTVSSFFNAIGDKIGSFGFIAPARSVSFSASLDRYDPIEFNAKNPVNITISGSTQASLRTGNLVTDKNLSLLDFRGTGKIVNNTLVLDGRMGKVELPDITVAVQETIKSNSTFSYLSVNGLETGDIRIIGTSGVIHARNATTRFSGDVSIESPAGLFEFHGANGVFYINGESAKISVPSAGISIG